jgi:hypothetical protein
MWYPTLHDEGEDDDYEANDDDAEDLADEVYFDGPEDFGPNPGDDESD